MDNYTPTAGEKKLLGDFNNRMADLDRVAQSAGSGAAILPETPSVAQSMAEGQANFDAGLGRTTNPAQSVLDGITRNSNLSGRQKAQAAMSLNDSGPLDTSGISGLSNRQNAALTIDQFKAGKATQPKPGELPSLAFADGGKIDPEELMRQMSAKYGAPAGGPAKSAAQPAPQPAPQPQPGSLLMGATSAIRNRAAQIDKATGYAQGGRIGNSPIAEEHAHARAHRQAKAAAERYAQGGKIQGPGTPTSDSIPAKVRETGEDILVSTGERIVSAEQEILLTRIAEMLGFNSVDAMLAAGTGKPVGPTIKRGKRAAATGGQFGNEDAETSLAPLNGQSTRAGSYPSKLEQALTGAQVTPAAPNLARGDVGPSQLQQSVQADLERHRGPAQPAPYSNEGRVVPQPITNGAKHPVSVPANRAAGAMLLGAEPIDNTPSQPLRTTDIANGGYLDRGNGILAQRGSNGQLNIANVGTENLTDSRKGAVDDSAAAMRDQQSNNPYWTPAAQLERMQRRRMTSDASDSTITDPQVKADALRGLTAMNAGRQGEAQAGLQNAQADQARATTEQMKTIEAMRGKLLDPNTPPEEQKRLERAFVAMRGQAEKPTNLQAIDVEEPIDPKQPLLGNRKVPYVFDPRTGQSRPMMQQQQPTDPMSQARAAIARGANKDAVNQRLRQLGLPEVR